MTLRGVIEGEHGACPNNGKQNAQCRSRIYLGPDNDQNLAFCPPGDFQSNQVREIIAILKVASAVPRYFPLKSISNSLYAINGLTEHLSTWEDNRWIGIKNAPLCKKTACILKQHIVTTSFQWTKLHIAMREYREPEVDAHHSLVLVHSFTSTSYGGQSKASIPIHDASSCPSCVPLPVAMIVGPL